MVFLALTCVITSFNLIPMSAILKKKFTRIGNSWGVIISSELLKISGIDPKKEFEMKVEKGKIVLFPHERTTSLDEKVTRSMTKFIKKYRSDLKKLAS